jgi:hypothetical protein
MGTESQIQRKVVMIEMRILKILCYMKNIMHKT